ncbi:methyl-CpG binding domain-containing protein [Phthorimaea operculella]|nr:methyl-CpG binding domain-containing protein [Phthorimaea operculella]
MRVSEIEHEAKVDANNKPVLPRRSVEVEDKRLPPGWTKHMVRRSLGSSAGKWDVVLMSPDNHRFHTKSDMKSYLEKCTDESIKAYEPVLMDFGMHLKLSRRMGWYTTTPDGEQQPPVETVPAGLLSAASPLVKRKNLSLKKRDLKEKKRQKLRMKLKYEPAADGSGWKLSGASGASGTSAASGELLQERTDVPPENVPLEDGCVYVGSLKVQIIQDLLRCPAEGCFKNFRNNTLLKMHIKHYHRELRKMLGATPKVLDLAYARTRPSAVEMRRLKLEQRHKKIKAKLIRPPKRPEIKLEVKTEYIKPEMQTPVKEEPKPPKIPRSQDSPKLRTILSKPVKRPKVLLPVVRRLDDTGEVKEEEISVDDNEAIIEPKVEVPPMDVLDFETAISTHTVTKPADLKRKDKKKKFASISKASEDEEWYGVNSDVETRSSYPRSGTPDSKMDQKLVSSESNEEQKEPNYMYTETGERIKIVHMKREEIINCHCGFREEDGLMVQCELCLCWQHALCHNIQKESEREDGLMVQCELCLCWQHALCHNIQKESECSSASAGNTRWIPPVTAWHGAVSSASAGNTRSATTYRRNQSAGLCCCEGIRGPPVTGAVQSSASAGNTRSATTYRRNQRSVCSIVRRLTPVTASQHWLMVQCSSASAGNTRSATTYRRNQRSVCSIVRRLTPVTASLMVQCELCLCWQHEIPPVNMVRALPLLATRALPQHTEGIRGQCVV